MFSLFNSSACSTVQPFNADEVRSRWRKTKAEIELSHNARSLGRRWIVKIRIDKDKRRGRMQRNTHAASMEEAAAISVWELHVLHKRVLLSVQRTRRELNRKIYHLLFIKGGCSRFTTRESQATHTHTHAASYKEYRVCDYVGAYMYVTFR